MLYCPIQAFKHNFHVHYVPKHYKFQGDFKNLKSSEKKFFKDMLYYTSLNLSNL